MVKPKSTDRVRAFRQRQRANRPPKKPPKSALERSREYRARIRALRTCPESDEFSSVTSIESPNAPSTSQDTLTKVEDSQDSEDSSEDSSADLDQGRSENDSTGPSTSMDASKNKISFDDRVKPKNVLALNEKVAAIRRYEADPVYKSVGRFFNCSPDQIKRIIKQKNEILAEWNNRTKKAVVPTSHEIKSVKMSFLGKAVHEWIRRMMYYTDFNLTDALIQTMAIEFKKVLGLQAFFPDKNWIANFRSTYDLQEVNTKTLSFGYQESHSVQIRDILRHLQDTGGCNRASPTDVTHPANISDQSTEESIDVDDFHLKEEPNMDWQGYENEIKTEDDTCNLPCSSYAVNPTIEEKPLTLPITVPSSITVALIAVKPEPIQTEPESVQPKPVQLKPGQLNLVQLKPGQLKSGQLNRVQLIPGQLKPVQLNQVQIKPVQPLTIQPISAQANPSKDAINTHVEAINCVKMLEDFALLKENFRLIGLIERLEEALKEKQ